MKPFICLFPLLVATFVNAGGQTADTANRIDLDLATLDLAPFEWEGEPDAAPPRLGIYLTAVPDDSVRAVTGRDANSPWYVIWHAMPHWSADAAGVLIGDTLTALNQSPIGDALHSGEEFINVVVRELSAGDTITLTVRRDGRLHVITVPLIALNRVPMAVSTPAALGPIRTGSWLERRVKENDLSDWVREIHRQLRIVADQDYSMVPFAGRPNPWRLNAVTYLHRHPMRTGSNSRMIVEDLWQGAEGGGLAGALRAAAVHLDCVVGQDEEIVLPTTVPELEEYLGETDVLIERAYAPVRDELPGLVADLAAMLDPTGDFETRIDAETDPLRRRGLRNEEEARIAALFTAADRVDRCELARAATRYARLADTSWLHTFAGELARGERGITGTTVPGVDGGVIMSWSTPYGLCVVGDTGVNRFTGSFAFILDLGGDDHYDLPAAEPGSARFVADLAGSDVYVSSTSSHGAGVGCLDLLVDVEGDDTYRSNRFSQGAGLLGVGVLADYTGDDVYTSHWCSQGAGFLGIGLLYDRSGNDNYIAGIYAQAFGYAGGFGGLLDASGNDSYRAGWEHPDPLGRWPDRAHISMSQGFGYGMRPWSVGIGTDGGIGVLSDRSGDDLYASDLFSQGGSYWYALGILHDGAGADRYTAGQYSQGSGIHLSFGALLDDGGDDMYDAYAGLEQGNAHDWSAGCLVDLAGNDTYRGRSASQGSALNVAFAWLLDRSGDDQYFILSSDTANSQGGGNFNRPREHGSLGMLLDFGTGTDYYVDPRAVPGRVVLKGSRGLLFDEGD